MKKHKLKVDIEVWGIEVEETNSYADGTGSGWYKYEYSVRMNGGKKQYGQKDGSWSNQSRLRFRRLLSGGYAAKQVLESL